MRLDHRRHGLGTDPAHSSGPDEGALDVANGSPRHVDPSADLVDRRAIRRRSRLGEGDCRPREGRRDGAIGIEGHDHDR
jgi:hypothetical protein